MSIDDINTVDQAHWRRHHLNDCLFYLAQQLFWQQCCTIDLFKMLPQSITFLCWCFSLSITRCIIRSRTRRHHILCTYVCVRNLIGGPSHWEGNIMSQSPIRASISGKYWYFVGVLSVALWLSTIFCNHHQASANFHWLEKFIRQL